MAHDNVFGFSNAASGTFSAGGRQNTDEIYVSFGLDPCHESVVQAPPPAPLKQSGLTDSVPARLGGSRAKH